MISVNLLGLDCRHEAFIREETIQSAARSSTTASQRAPYNTPSS
jgi:hypothetical protein